MPQMKSLLTGSKAQKNQPPRLRPMTDEESMVLIDLTFAELRKGEISDAVKKTVIYQIIEARLAQTGRPAGQVANSFVRTLCTVLSESRPGTAVLWAYTLKQIRDETGAPVTLESFTDPMYFGYGVPTEDFYHEVWLSQKGFTLGHDDVDNWLDTAEPWRLGLAQL